MKKYEVTFIDSGKTVIWSRRQLNAHFGKPQADEVIAGYLPHIVCVEV